MYRLFFRLVLSRLDPEFAHHLAFLVIRWLPILGIGSLVRRTTRPAPGLGVTALGLEFDSPFGVAAGFDKDARGIRGLGQLGFGHVEIGTVTALAQPGNDKPRLFRLIPDRAVINRMGFNNVGAAAVAPRLAREAARRNRPVIGANIGKSRAIAVEDARPRLPREHPPAGPARRLPRRQRELTEHSRAARAAGARQARPAARGRPRCRGAAFRCW